MIRTILAGVSAAALMTAAANAQVAENPTMKAPAEAGASINATDVKTRNDAKAYAKAEFADADANGDAEIDKAEFVAAVNAETDTSAAVNDPLPGSLTAPVGEAAGALTPEEQFAKISNGDDAITEKELVDARLADFNLADSDKDGALNASEQRRFTSLVALRSAA